MRTFRLQAPNPDLGENVTRLWVAPDYKRIAAMFGPNASESTSVACWEDVAREPVWEAALVTPREVYAPPQFSNDLDFVVAQYAKYAKEAEDTFYVTPANESAKPRYFLGNENNAIAPQIPTFSPDGQFLYAAVHNRNTRRNEIARWDAAALFKVCARKRGKGTFDGSPDKGWSITVNLRGMFNFPVSLAVSADNRFLAMGSYGGSASICNLATGRAVVVLPTPIAKSNPRIEQLAFAQDGSQLAILRYRRVKNERRFDVSLCEAKRGAKELKVRETGSVNGMAFSADGTKLYTACASGSVGVWDVSKLKKLREYRWNIGELFCVVVAPDGLTCAAGGENGQVVVWDIDA